MYVQKNKIVSIMHLLLWPFEVWWRIYRKNVSLRDDKGAKNIQEKITFWSVTYILLFVIVFLLAVIVDTIRSIIK